MRHPVAVLIADVHYSISTLPLADAAMRQAINYANDRGLRLIVAGDLHDTKAQMRGECVSAMLDTFTRCVKRPTVLVGNHCRLHEKSKSHSLEFLRGLADIVTHPVHLYTSDMFCVPYESDPVVLKEWLETVPEKGSTLIMHQGVQTASMGHYVQDKSSLPKEAFADFRVVSGHYHMRQDIKCGKPRKGAVGLFSYIGNPFTLNFGEANDPAKGFQVLYSDGSLKHVPTYLRKHIIVTTSLPGALESIPNYIPGDLVWIKVNGPRSQLAKLNKNEMGQRLFGHSNFKLDLIPSDPVETKALDADKHTDAELMDALIARTGETPEQATNLKSLWRELME